MAAKDKDKDKFILPLFYKNINDSTSCWTDEEFGAYMRLLIYQWSNGFIPSDMKRLLRIAESSEKNWVMLKEKFTPIEGGYQNKVMEDIRIEEKSFRETKSINGGKGGNPNFKKGNKNPYYNSTENQAVILFNEQKDNQEDNLIHNQEDNLSNTNTNIKDNLKDNQVILNKDNQVILNGTEKDNSTIKKDNQVISKKDNSGYLNGNVKDNLKDKPTSTSTSTSTTTSNSNSTSTKNYLKIREKIILQKISDFCKENLQMFIEQWQMKNPDTPVDLVLARMDDEYINYEFTNENHVKNCFKSCFAKIEKEKSSAKKEKFVETPQEKRIYTK